RITWWSVVAPRIVNIRRIDGVNACRDLARPPVCGSGRLVGGDSFACQRGVFGVGVVAHVVTTGTYRRDPGAPRTHERVEHGVALVGVELDQTAGQVDRERGGVAHAFRALG